MRELKKRPQGGNNSNNDTDLHDISGEVPEVDDVLAQVDKALARGKDVEKAVKRRKKVRKKKRTGGCGCGF